MKISIAHFDKHLQQGLKPVYLIAGDEPLQAMEIVDALCAEAKRQGFSERQIFNVEGSFDWSQLLTEVYSMSLFAERKILDVRMPSGKPGIEGAKVLREYAQKPVDDTLLLLQTGRLEKQATASAWVKALEQAGVFVQIWDLTPQDTLGWVRRRLHAAGFQPQEEAVRLLTERIEGNLLAGVQEVQKLRLLLEPGPLSLEAVKAAVTDSSRFDIFELSDAALAGHGERAARILHVLKGEGLAEAQVLWALSRELRLLTQFADLNARRESAEALFKKERVWDTRRTALVAAVRRYPLPVWSAMLQQCSEIDRLIKGRRGHGNAWDELLELTLWMSGRPLWPQHQNRITA